MTEMMRGEIPDQGGQRRSETLPLTEKQEQLLPLREQLDSLLRSALTDNPITDGSMRATREGKFSMDDPDNVTVRTVSVNPRSLETLKTRINEMTSIIGEIERIQALPGSEIDRNLESRY